MNVKLFFKLREKCKLIEDEYLANKKWESPNSFKHYLENKQKISKNIGQIKQIIAHLVQGLY